MLGENKNFYLWARRQRAFFPYTEHSAWDMAKFLEHSIFVKHATKVAKNRMTNGYTVVVLLFAFGCAQFQVELFHFIVWVGGSSCINLRINSSKLCKNNDMLKSYKTLNILEIVFFHILTKSHMFG